MSRSRRKARDAKYTMGIDPGVDGADTYVLGRMHLDSGIFEVTATGVREHLSRMSTEEIGDLFADLTGQPLVIEGEFVPVETRDDHLLDAGGSEP